MPTYLDAPGEPTEPSKLTVHKAQALAIALESSAIEFASLVECRTASDSEVIVFDVEVELGQLKKHPIDRYERIAAVFDREDRDMPGAYALREDFPRVPHLNLCPFEKPRSLCLYDERYRDIKRRWTAPRFVERVREWLALTAKGRLHQGDQPLEPLLLDHIGTIVLPVGLLDDDADKIQAYLTVTVARNEPGKYFLIAERNDRQAEKKGLRIVASVHRTKPQQHGLISHRPQNIKELSEFVSSAGLDLIAELRTRLGEWHTASNTTALS